MGNVGATTTTITFHIFHCNRIMLYPSDISSSWAYLLGLYHRVPPQVIANIQVRSYSYMLAIVMVYDNNLCFFPPNNHGGRDYVELGSMEFKGWNYWFDDGPTVVCKWGPLAWFAVEQQNIDKNSQIQSSSFHWFVCFWQIKILT